MHRVPELDDTEVSLVRLFCTVLAENSRVTTDYIFNLLKICMSEFLIRLKVIPFSPLVPRIDKQNLLIFRQTGSCFVMLTQRIPKRLG